MEETLVLANRLEELDRLARWLQERSQAWGLAPEATQALGLALEEVVVNVMNHAYGPGVGKTITVRLARQEGRVVAQVLDQGPAYDPLSAPAPSWEVPLLERAPGGLGVYLVRQMMDEMTWERQGETNLLTMVKRLP